MPAPEVGTQAMHGQGVLRFRCNICGAGSAFPVAAFDREKPSCATCGSTIRMRAMVHALSWALFGRSLAIADFPSARHIVGVGMSDWEGYATRLAQKLGYCNTYYHQDPRLDITRIRSGDAGSLDFLLSTDVFEHVAPPVSTAFRNALRLLKPGGVFVFSVPYRRDGETIEHFPDLYEYALVERGSERILKNRTRTGEDQEFSNLVFHGGPGDTLEMRSFSLSGVLGELRAAGFRDIQVLETPCFEHGIWHREADSLPIIARAEPSALQVEAYGPVELHARVPGSVEGGSDTFWIKVGEHALAELTVTIGDAPATMVHVGSSVITGIIPDAVRRAPGCHPIVVRPAGRPPVGVGSLYILDS